MANNQQLDPPLSDEALLLLEVIERELTAREKAILKEAARRDPMLRSTAEVMKRLVDEKAALQYERGQNASWKQFNALLGTSKTIKEQYIPNGARVNPFSGVINGIKGVLTRSPTFVATVLIVQLVAIFWLATPLHTEQAKRPAVSNGVYRSLPGQSACAPFIVFFKGQITESELRRVLLQHNLRIVDGPTQQGGFIMSAPGFKLDRLRTTLANIADRMEVNADCPDY